MRDSRLEPFFIDGTNGRIFLLLRAPRKPQGCVLVVPPFAEEMNKARRQITETAAALVDAGYAVLQPDLYGTGDSAGSFEDATWDGWLGDIEATCQWADNAGLTVNVLLGARLGCVLGAEALRLHDRKVRCTVFWQPVDTGRQFMTRFLRLRVAASMMDENNRETVDDLRDRLRRGESLNIAGYQLSASMWQSIERLGLQKELHMGLGDVELLEVARSGDELSAASRSLVESATAAGIRITGQRLTGEPFWTSTEIVSNSCLTVSSVEFVRNSAQA